MPAIIVSIGDELVLGQTVDTNSAWLSRELAAIGLPVAAHVTVGDDQRAIAQVIVDSVLKCDALIISGGLGPTADDLTRQALAAVMDRPLELNEAWLEQMRKFFNQRGRPMPESNAIQAMIPKGAQAIFNTCGTAAGIRAVLGTAEHRCDVFVVPGVPKEMMAMFDKDVLPHIRQLGRGGVILSRTLHTFGVGESAVAEKLGLLMDRSRNPLVGTTVSGGIVSLRINSRFDDRDKAELSLDQTAAACRNILGELIFGQDEQTLPMALGQMLRESKQTVATAESCTGGLLSKMITDVPGSSEYFRYGWVTYANEAKQLVLDVPAEVLARHGAVSDPVVRALAKRARHISDGDYGLAISGVAGPGGGSDAKPVGLVFIALDDDQDTLVRSFNFPGDREMIRDRAAKMALSMLRYRMLGIAMPL